MNPHLRSPQELASYILEDSRRPDTEHTVAATEHRQNLIKLWGIPLGARVLEIGCGQGYFVVPLADAVGPTGRVVGIDPLGADVGTPPLGVSWEHIRKSPVGAQVEFVDAEGISYLQQTQDMFDFIILGHSVWYFADCNKLSEMMSHAKRQTRARFLIAEYHLAASCMEAVPHILTALCLNTLESLRGNADTLRNIRCALSPEQMVAAADSSGWVLEKSQSIIPPAGQRDGWREVVSKFCRRSLAVDDWKK